MRICIDLDGTICFIKKPNEKYSDVLSIPGAIEKLKKWKADGHYIIIHTARHMKTCDGDVGKVVARIGQETLEWFAKHDIPFDEIHFGKPFADVYIDDKALKFTSWQEIENL